jgi:hypothetical protein
VGSGGWRQAERAPSWRARACGRGRAPPRPRRATPPAAPPKLPRATAAVLCMSMLRAAAGGAAAALATRCARAPGRRRAAWRPCRWAPGRRSAVERLLPRPGEPHMRPGRPRAGRCGAYRAGGCGGDLDQQCTPNACCRTKRPGAWHLTSARQRVGSSLGSGRQLAAVRPNVAAGGRAPRSSWNQPQTPCALKVRALHPPAGVPLRGGLHGGEQAAGGPNLATGSRSRSPPAGS